MMIYYSHVYYWWIFHLILYTGKIRLIGWDGTHLAICVSGSAGQTAGNGVRVEKVAWPRAQPGRQWPYGVECAAHTRDHWCAQCKVQQRMSFSDWLVDSFIHSFERKIHTVPFSIWHIIRRFLVVNTIWVYIFIDWLTNWLIHWLLLPAYLLSCQC